MSVDEQSIITIAYELRENNEFGPLLERMDHKYPFKFYFGNGKLLPAFEKKLFGLAEGDSFAFILTPEEAYGPIEAGNIIDLPHSAFTQIGPNALVEGNYVSLTDDEGMTHNGKILGWNDERVKVDFNHAFAGKHLHFSGVILNIRPATLEELIQKSYLPEDGLRSPDPEEEW